MGLQPSNGIALSLQSRTKVLGKTYSSRFFTRAKQTVTREFNFTCSTPPPTPPAMLDTCTRNFSRVSTLYCVGEGAATHFKKESSAFANSVFKTHDSSNVTSVPRNFVYDCSRYQRKKFNSQDFIATPITVCFATTVFSHDVTEAISVS